MLNNILNITHMAKFYCDLKKKKKRQSSPTAKGNEIDLGVKGKS